MHDYHVTVKRKHVQCLLLCKDDLVTMTPVTAVKPVARLPTSDAENSDGEEFCDSFDMSGFLVRLM